jgi:hypothetical protein
VERLGSPDRAKHHFKLWKDHFEGWGVVGRERIDGSVSDAGEPAAMVAEEAVDLIAVVNGQEEQGGTGSTAGSRFGGARRAPLRLL